VEQRERTHPGDGDPSACGIENRAAG